MTKIRKIAKILYNLVRMSILKLEHIGSLKNDWQCLISPRCDLQIGLNAKLSIGRRVCIEKYSLIAVRKSASFTIGDGVYINRNCIMVAHEGISIGNGVTIGPNCCIYDHDHDPINRGEYLSKTVTIENNAWLGANVLVMKGVTIGEGAVVAAGSVVTKDIPPHCILLQKKIDTIKEIL